MSETKYRGVKRVVGESMYAGECSIVESKAPGVTLDCEKYLNDKEALAALSGPVKTYHISDLKGEIK